MLDLKVLSVIVILQDEVDLMVYVMKIEKTPLDSYADIGGIEAQSHEIKEAVELPLTHPQLYAHIGIMPSKGVIFYGERGTGKTVLAKMTEPWKLEDGQPRNPRVPLQYHRELGLISLFQEVSKKWFGLVQILHQKQVTPGKPSS
ncbi:hypothetical protein F2Q69_00054595 [Brassica cretica]|uniref:Vesicle-fusing ATPase n=1 Tax=Brassica cretica TaxID=69181 RepID=A0A8S9N391_BRACR|nr:hypothetical protein F2Q69_00054595 [Brassica cretica]